MARRSLPLILLVVVTSVVTAFPSVADPGELDPSFSGNGSATVFTHGSVGTSVAVDPRGRTLVAGYTVDGDVDVAVARFLSDGSLDPGFGGGDGRVRIDLGGAEYAFDVGLVPGGGIVLAGRRTAGNTDRAFVLRLGGRGEPSATFGDGGLAIVDLGKRYQAATAIGTDGAGRIVLAGWISNGTLGRSVVARLRPGGSLDRSFSHDGLVVVDLSGGGEQLRDVTVRSDGASLAAGEAERGGHSRFALVALRSNGSFDRAVGGGDGVALTDLGPGPDTANAIALRRDGTIVLAGTAGHDWGVVRYRSDGRLDGSFGDGGRVVVPFSDRPEAAQDVVATSRRIVVVGSIFAAGSQDMAIVRIRDDGRIDTAFADDGVARVGTAGSAEAGRAIVAQRRGLVVAGESWEGGLPRMLAARLLLS